jgi:hypothetical protein
LDQVERALLLWRCFSDEALKDAGSNVVGGKGKALSIERRSWIDPDSHSLAGE